MHRSGKAYFDDKQAQEKQRIAVIKRKYFKSILPRAAREGLVAKARVDDVRSSGASEQTSGDDRDDQRRPSWRANTQLPSSGSEGAPPTPSEPIQERVSVWQGAKPKGPTFTARGQPVMRHRLFRLVGQLERETNAGLGNAVGGKHGGKFDAPRASHSSERGRGHAHASRGGGAQRPHQHSGRGARGGRGGRGGPSLH